VVIPTLAGGAVLEHVLAAIRGQATQLAIEIVCVDSGSPAGDLAMMSGFGVRLLSIERSITV
jgi:hypothetical protein